MFRRTVTRVGVPAVVVAGLLMAGPAWAQHDGGDSASAAASSGSASARALEVILKASGVPNQNGQVAWPLAFRLLRGDALMQQLEGQLQLAVEQVTAGGVNPLLLDEIRLNVKALRQVLRADKERRFSLPEAVYEDAKDPGCVPAREPVGSNHTVTGGARLPRGQGQRGTAGAQNNGAGERSVDEAYETASTSSALWYCPCFRKTIAPSEFSTRGGRSCFDDSYSSVLEP